MKGRVFKLLSLTFAFVPVITIGFDLINSNRNLVNYFSTFTILSALMVSVIFLILLKLGSEYKSRFIDSARGAITIYMIVSGAVYFVLLRNLPDDPAAPTIQWVNYTLHYILPLIMISFWIVFPPREKLGFRQIFPWMIFPIVYVIYSLVRGSLINWYPFPFLDPTINGYTAVFITLTIMLMAGIVLALGLIFVGNKLMLQKRNG